jgi:Gpi18-like mannosyltransferase
VFCDYPPFNVYLFAGFGNMARLIGMYNMETIYFLVKFIPNLFDLATASLIFYFVRKRASFKLGLIAAALYAFNPAVIFDASVWGQQDAVYTFFIVFSLILALESKPKFSAGLFALAILTKPQSIAFLPLIIFLIYNKSGMKKLFTSIAIFALTVFLVILPFTLSNQYSFLSQIYLGAYNYYKFTSTNAFNFWGPVMYQPDGNLFILGWALFAALSGAVLYVSQKHFKAKDEVFLVFSAFILFFGFFMLPTRIHERYLFPTISLLALSVPFIKKARPVFAVLTATFLVNQAYILYLLNHSIFHPQQGDWIVLTVSGVNILTFFYVLKIMLNGTKLPKFKLTKNKQNPASQNQAEAPKKSALTFFKKKKNEEK